MANNDTTVEVEEKATTSKTKTTSKATASMDITNAEMENLKEQIKQQNAQIALLLQMMQQTQSNTTNMTSYGQTVKIIHLVQRAPGLTTYIQLSNLVITMSDFGEERTLNLQQFEELIGKYRSWFNTGMISVAAGYEDVASTYGLKTAKDYPIDSSFIKDLGTMDMQTLEDVFPKLPQSGKDFIVSYWNRKAMAKDPAFCNIRKLETLDRISDGGCQQVLVDLKNKKD